MTYLLTVVMGVVSGAEANKEPERGASVLCYVVKDIDGNDVDLAKYKGKVVVIVNVASKCGFTPQYKQLEALYKKYKKDGLAILGFPANDFLWQEPGTNDEIKQFCALKYNVTFDMFAKISVKGTNMAPLYKDLISKRKNGSYGGAIKWNFTKFVVGRDGKVCARFGSRTTPDDAEVVATLERELAKKAEGKPESDVQPK